MFCLPKTAWPPTLKIIFVVLALSLVIMAAVGVVYAQSVNAQNQNGIYSQTPTQGSNGYYGCYPPNIGNGYNYYTQNPQQGEVGS